MSILFPKLNKPREWDYRPIYYDPEKERRKERLKELQEERRERELVYVNRTTYDGPIQPSKDELDGGRFWTMQEIREAIGQGLLTPNFESEFQRFFLKSNNQ